MKASFLTCVICTIICCLTGKGLLAQDKKSGDESNNEEFSITSQLVLDYRTGKMFFNSKSIGVKGKKDNARIFGVKDGQAISVLVRNINPLKYYVESSVAYINTIASPPALTGVNINDLFKDVKMPSAAPAEKTAVPENPEDTSAGAMDDGGFDKKKVEEMEQKINCISGTIQTIKQAQVFSQEIGNSFEAFNEYYQQMKTADNIDKESFYKYIDEGIVQQIKEISSKINQPGITIVDRYSINAKNINLLKNAITEAIRQSIEEMNECYETLFDELNNEDNGREKDELQRRNEKDRLKLMLSQLPATRKEFYKLQDWAEKVKEANDKVWPAVNKILSLVSFSLNLNFDLPAGTVMADEDVTNITLTIKNISDNKEVRKIERIKFHTIGGFRLEYGVGLYVTGLGDDEFVFDRTSRIEKVPILNGTTIDTVLQSVGYTTPRISEEKAINWGTMTFFQGRSNWGGGFNIGGYFGLGILLNNNAKPIFSTGASIVLGRIPRGNINIGAVWGKVNRLNPKYGVGKEYKGDIIDVTVSKTSYSMLVGLTWNLGKVGAGAGK
jgi:hypothetical protein